MCVYLQQLNHIGGLVEHLLELMQDDVVAVAAARVGSYRPQGEVKPLAAGVPLDGNLGKVIACLFSTLPC